MKNICGKCKTGFLRPSLLEKHYADVHKINPTYSCSICGYNSPSRKSANRHYNQCCNNNRINLNNNLSSQECLLETNHSDDNFDLLDTNNDHGINTLIDTTMNKDDCENKGILK